MHSVPVIYNHPQKLVLKRKNSQIRLSASPVTEEGEPCCLCLEELFAVKKKTVYLSPQICKETVSLTENKSLELGRPSLLSGAEIQWHFSKTVCALSDLLLVLWFSAVLLLVWETVSAVSSWVADTNKIIWNETIFGILDNDGVRF